MELQMKRLPHATGLDLPAYASQLASGMDLRAAIQDPVRLEPGKRMLIPTGIAVAVPPGFEAQIRPRSGLALREGITMLNSPGTIDADYRGEVMLIVINHGNAIVEIQRGERLAQMVICPVARPEIRVVDELEDTDRGSGGFGSTGRR